MKWYKHISDSIHDPFIFSLIEEFGGDGYLVFFGVLEIYSREFSPKDDWILTEKLSYFHRNLLISSSKFKKILSRITKWDVSYQQDTVSIYIPKFRELLDESTLKKLREHEKSLRNRSGMIPKSATTEEEEDGEEEEDKDLKATEPPVDNSPKQTPDDDDSPPLPNQEKPKPGNTHGERWTPTQGEQLDGMMQEIATRYGFAYHGRVLRWVRDNLNRRNPEAMLHCLQRLIRDRMAGRSIPLPEKWLEAALNGNGKHPGENGKFEAEETERAAAEMSGPVSDAAKRLVAGIGGRR